MKNLFDQLKNNCGCLSYEQLKILITIESLCADFKILEDTERLVITSKDYCRFSIPIAELYSVDCQDYIVTITCYQFLITYYMFERKFMIGFNKGD